MPITVTEKFGRRLSEEGELSYDIAGTTDAAAARAAMIAAAPSTFGGLLLDTASASVEEIEAGEGYVGRVSYKATGASPDTGESKFSFDTGGGTQHITQSIANISKTAAAGTAPDCKGAIGVTKDSIEGTDILLRQFSFTFKKYKSVAAMTATYIGYLYNQTATVNDADVTLAVPMPDGTSVNVPFLAGELLLTRVTGSDRPEKGDYELSFSFSASPNRTSIAVGDITVPAKKGWELLWVKYKEEVSENSLVKQPIAAYVEKVYETSTFSNLGI